ncbi:hypothetical protein [Oceanobacter mangrovi]|uniref:hypothetical protein n=1 Tax=Oceanobacter mangrovi TaxID=2862510 RepID=UPI001C8D6E4C|nr:hypothetical protein [Oceanobacter mangrovi]
MSAIGLVIAIALPVALLMVAMVIYGRHQQQQQSMRMQAKLILSKAEELYEALELLILIDNFQEIQLLVAERIDHMLQLAQQQWPKGAEEITAKAEKLDTEVLRAKINENHEPRMVLKSDREIHFAKRQVARIMSVLNAMAKRKEISATSLNDYRRYLRVILLEREVDTFTAQGDVAAQRGDILTASNYYKAARKLLIEFDLQYPEKNDKIRILSKRSTDLYSGTTTRDDALAKALSREAEKDEPDVHGIPVGLDEKRKY